MANYGQCSSLSWSQVSPNDVMASDAASDLCQKEICSWRRQCSYEQPENDSSPMEQAANLSSAPCSSSSAVSLWTMSHLASEETDRFTWSSFGHRQSENNRVDYCQWSVERSHDDDPSHNEFLSAYDDDRRDFTHCSADILSKFNFYGGDDDGSSRMEFYVNDLSTALDCERDCGPCVGDQVVYRPFPLLETIVEETVEELNSEMEVHSEPSESSSPSSSSGPWGWGWGWLTSDDDSSSVIHMPLDQKSPARLHTHAGSHAGAVDAGATAECRRMSNLESADEDLSSLSSQSSPSTSESEWSERDQEVPKKKRKLDDGSDSVEEEEEPAKAEAEGSRSPSVTESLIQFEALEKEIGDLCQSCDDDDPFAFCADQGPDSVVFRISATTEPFEEDDNQQHRHLEALRPTRSPAPSGDAAANSVAVEEADALDWSPEKQERGAEGDAAATEPTREENEIGDGSVGERQGRDFHCRNKSDGGTKSVSAVPLSALLLLRAWSSLDAFSSDSSDKKSASWQHAEENSIRTDDGSLERPQRSRSVCDIPNDSDEHCVGRPPVPPPVPVRIDSAVRTAAKAALIDGHFAVEQEWKKLSAEAERNEMAYRYGDFGEQEPHQDDDDDEEDRQWEPDGYLGSDSDDYQRESNSNSHSSDSDSEYSAERGDRFDESHFGLVFGKDRSPVVSAGAIKMRSYRSFDSLNLLVLSSTADEEVVVPERASFILQSRNSLTSVREGEEDEADSAGSSNSHNESSSNSPVDRSSPEEYAQEFGGTRRRNDRRRVALQRSVEALSEDSGYGDSSASGGLLNSPENSRGTFTSAHSPQNMCGPDEAAQAADSHPEEAGDRVETGPDDVQRETDADDDDDDDDEYESAVEELEESGSREAKAMLDDGRLDDRDANPAEFKGADQLLLSSSTSGWQLTFSEEEQETKSVECVTNQEETRQPDSDGMLTESRADVSALLQRRRPRSRPAPLSLREAEEFLNSDAREATESRGESYDRHNKSYGYAGGGEEACDVTIRHRRRMESSGCPPATWESPRCGSQGPAEWAISIGQSKSVADGSHSSCVLDTNRTSVTCADDDPFVSCIRPMDRYGRYGSYPRSSHINSSNSSSGSNNTSGHVVGSSANLAAAKFSPLHRQIGSGRETSQQQEMEELEGEGALLLHPSSSCGDEVKPHANLPHLAAGSSCAPDEQSAASAAAATAAASHGSADWAENVTRCLWPSSSSSSPSVGHPTPSASVAKVRNVEPEMSVADQEDRYPPRVVLKRYARHDVEVYLSKQQPSKSSPSVVGFTPKSSTPPASGGKGVHFSPIVSAVNWRESYLDDGDEDGVSPPEQNPQDPEESVRAKNDRNSQQRPDDQVQKVRVVAAQLVPASPSNVHKVQLVTTCPAMAVPQDPADATAVHPIRNNATEIPSSVTSLASTSASAGAGESECESDIHKAGADTEEQHERGRSKKKEKAPLFQRFSLARLSARMSATFSRSASEAKRTASPTRSSKKDAVADSAGPEAAAGCNESARTTNSGQKSPAEKENGHERDPDVGKDRKSSSGDQRGNGSVVVTVQKVKEKIKGKEKSKEKDKLSTNVDKGDKKEAKSKNKTEGSGRNFFSRKFYRSSSTPPAVNRKSLSSSTAADQPPAVADASAKTDVAMNVTPDVGSSCSPGGPQPSNEQVMTDRPADGAGVEPSAAPREEHVAMPPERTAMATTTTTEAETTPREAEAEARPPLPAKSSTLAVMRHPAVKSAEGEEVAPIPPPRNASKPPLPPQVRPRTFHARKLHYLVTEKNPDPTVTSPGGADTHPTAPPVPVISSVALQLALEHFKETARRERERLAKSVPDLVAMDQQTRRDNRTPTSPSIDRPVTSAEGCTPPPSGSAGSGPSASRAEASSEDVTAIRDGSSRCRARQAALSRASSVESAWNATLSKAALSLSRRNIASSNSNISTTTAEGGGGAKGGRGGTGREPAIDGNSLDGGPLARSPASAASNGHARQSVGTGLLETNLDEDAYETNLDELIQNLEFFAQSYRSPSYNAATAAAAAAAAAGPDAASAYYTDKKYKSMLNLGSSSAPVSVQPDIEMVDAATGRCTADPSRAKSMEFLLDDENKSTIQIPENELKKAGERQMSEHELRIQRSLQKLNVPDWFKNAPKTPVNGMAALSGGLRRRDIHGSSSLGSSLRGGGWAGFSRDSKTSSMTSLGSLASRSATPTRVIIPTRVRPPSDWRQVKSSRESLQPLSPSTGSAVVSPSISSSSPLQQQQQQQQQQQVFQWSGPSSIHSTGSYAGGSNFQRWGSGRLSYGCPSPAPSTSSTYRSSLLGNRTPVYLGWRSQEKLNGSAALSAYQSPAERLASSLKKNSSAGSPEAPTLRIDEPVVVTEAPTPAESPAPLPDVQEDVRTSIREVTSAIVHYVTENASPGQRSPAAVHPAGRVADEAISELSRSPSPRRQRCVWLESSFVGPAPRTTAPLPAPSPPRSPSPARGVSPTQLANHNYRLINERPACTSDVSVTVNVTQPRSDLAMDATFPPVVSVTADTPTGESTPTDVSATRGRIDDSTATLDDVLNSLLGLAPDAATGGFRCGILPRPTSQPAFHHKQRTSSDEQCHGSQMNDEIRSCGDLRSSRSNGTLSNVAGRH